MATSPAAICDVGDSLAAGDGEAGGEKYIGKSHHTGKAGANLQAADLKWIELQYRRNSCAQHTALEQHVGILGGQVCCRGNQDHGHNISHKHCQDVLQSQGNRFTHTWSSVNVKF